MKKLTDSALLHEGTVPYITFPLLDDLGMVWHGFSTRLGGVSTGIYESMNLDFRCNEPRENVTENYRRITGAMGIDMADLVLSAQTHTTNIRRMSRSDRGKGFTRLRDYTDVDGMITNEPGVALTGLFADCVPLLFVDPKNHAIALSHAGWKGTAGRIAEKTVKALTDEFGSLPENIFCVAGPSICKDCYEVSEDVASALTEAYQRELKAYPGIITEMGNGKFLADLQLANTAALKSAGVPEENIAISGLCTSCMSSLLWSHRATAGKRGEMAAFIELRESFFS